MGQGRCVRPACASQSAPAESCWKKFKNTNKLIKSKSRCSLNFPEGESPLQAEVTLRTVSKLQGGMKKFRHWRKWDCKIRYWQTGTVYEAIKWGWATTALWSPKSKSLYSRYRRHRRKENALTRGDPNPDENRERKSAEVIVVGETSHQQKGGGLTNQWRTERQVAINSIRRFKLRVCQPYLKVKQRYCWWKER